MDTLLQVGLSNALVATLLALLVFAITRGNRRRPALVHGLWLLVLLKLVTPPLVRVPIPWLEREVVSTIASSENPRTELPNTLLPLPEEMDSLPLLPVPSVHDERIVVEVVEAETPLAQSALRGDAYGGALIAPSTRVDWQITALWVWLAGTVGWLFLALYRVGKFQGLLRFGERAPSEVQRQVARLSDEVGLARAPCAWMLPGRFAPMIWCVGTTPRLLLPTQLWAQLDEDQQETLLVHELAHLQRRDHWIRPVEMFVLALYWWFPLVWFARRELREAEEQCCDAWVVTTLPEKGKQYAVALVETLDFLASAPAAPALASGVGQVADLKRRLTMILSGTTPRTLSWKGWLFVGALAMLLPTLPTLAQPPKTETIRVEVNESKVEKDSQQLRDAQQALEKARAELVKKQAELRAAQRRLGEAAHRLQRLGGQPKPNKPQPAVEFPRVNSKAILLEITGLPKEADLLRLGLDKGQLERIRAILREHPKKRIQIRLDQQNRITVNELPQPAFDPRVPSRPRPPVATPRNPLRPPSPSRVARPVVTSDRRIEDLERKLNDVMRELQRLRHEMRPQKQPPRPVDPFSPNEAGEDNDPYRTPRPPKPAPDDRDPFEN